MLGIIYIVLALALGYVLANWLLPDLAGATEKDFAGNEIKLCSLFVQFPTWLYLGILPLTWAVYLGACLFHKTGHGLAYSNAVFFIVAAGIISLYFVKKAKQGSIKPDIRNHCRRAELLFLVILLVLSAALFYRTFYIRGDELIVGLSVFSDFSPHLGMIRSFSYGDNFPTGYSHFAGADIKYHFMFQFLVGNLEYLGLRLDHAFNLPSILGFMSTLSLLYVLAAKIVGRRKGGFFACILFLFRASFSFFSFLAKLPKGTNLLSAVFCNQEFIGYTPNENWGLWNLNVYCNQRHLAFTLGVLILVLLLYIPHFYEAAARRRGREKKSVMSLFRETFFSAPGWNIKDVKLAVTLGLLLGMLSFWNGAVTIAALLVLFVLAVFSDCRSEHLITAVIAVIITEICSLVFIDGSVVDTTVQFGFIAENKTFFGVMDYLFRLCGPLLITVFAGFLLLDGVRKYLVAAFSLPLIFSFWISLTPDVTVNHKYIMISAMLLGIAAAYVLTELCEKKKPAMKVGMAILLTVLTITGIFDFITVWNRNKKVNNLTFDRNDPLTAWVKENATAEDIFLTSNYALNNVVLGGAMLYNGWQYFAWSAGYDTVYRDEQVKRMYEAEDIPTLDSLVKENNIRYIIVDFDNRVNEAYDVREDVIAAAYERVFENGEEDDFYSTHIYDVTKPLF